MVRIYNRVARALIEFETLWQQAWLQSLEVARAGLQATLIVSHPDTGDCIDTTGPACLMKMPCRTSAEAASFAYAPSFPLQPGPSYSWWFC